MDQSEVFDNSTPSKTQVQAYNKIKVLGEGSMGKAYLVESNADHKMYVMKRINIGHLPPEQQQIAMREAQLHSLVHHPNVIDFKEIYHTTKDKLCIIMEYAENGDLDQFIGDQNGKPLPEDTVLQYFSQICLGLREIHSKKIIHRDIKGANVFLSQGNVVKIGDFGISKIIDQTVQASKSFVGTPYYLAPEMVEGKPYSTKADIWALGVLLYNLCAQKLPFEANSLPLLALKILKGSFPPLTGPYSLGLKKLIISMLQVDQRKRPSANEILTKPLLAKYVSKEELDKIKKDMEIKKSLPSKSSVSQTGNTLQSNPAKIQKKNIVKKGEQDKKNVDKDREEKKRKREEESQQMKNDIRRKKMQFQKQKHQSNKNIPQKSEEHPLIKTKSVVIEKTNEKIEEKEGEKTLRSSKAQQKPWKVKNKNNIKKDVEVQILVPKIKEKVVKKQVELPQIIDFNIEIKQFGKRPPPKISVSQSLKQEVNDQGQNISSPEHQQTIESELHSQQEQNSVVSDEQITQDLSQSQSSQQNGKFQEMMHELSHAKQLVEGLKMNPNRKIQLYEQSQNFSETDSFPSKQAKAPTDFERQSLQAIHDAENLQFGRQIIEQAIGQDRYMQAHKILTQHIEQSEQKDRSQGKQNQAFNKEVLRAKLPFLSDWEFQSYIVLMYTLLIIELEEMKKNFQE